MKQTSRVLCAVGLMISLSGGCDDDSDDGTNDNGGTTSDAGRDSGAGTGSDASVGLDGSAGSGLDAGRDAATSDGSADAAVALSEGEVVSLATAINNGEIQAGTLASTKGTDPDVRDYATMMVTMHGEANARAAALGIAPVPNAQTTQIEQMATTALTTLQNAAPGAAFDRAYIDSQVAMHQSALTVFDTALLPNARTPALLSELQRVRGEVVTHLDQARQLQSDGGLSSGADGGT